jgi:hypothetical protein
MVCAVWVGGGFGGNFGGVKKSDGGGSGGSAI